MQKKEGQTLRGYGCHVYNTVCCLGINHVHLDIMVRFGKFHGHIQNTATYWLHVHTTARCLFGRNNPRDKHKVVALVPGQKSRNTHSIQLQVCCFRDFTFLYPNVRVLFFFIVNSISWAPHELGAIVACASSDGKLSVLTFKSTYRYPMWNSVLMNHFR